MKQILTNVVVVVVGREFRQSFRVSTDLTNLTKPIIKLTETLRVDIINANM